MGAEADKEGDRALLVAQANEPGPHFMDCRFSMMRLDLVFRDSMYLYLPCGLLDTYFILWFITLVL